MQLIWFRFDLRLQDHTALWHATQAGPTIALVVISAQQWQLHHEAPIKIDFYLRQLHALKDDLAKLNIPLIIMNVDLWHNLPEVLLALCQRHRIQNVHANIELGVNEFARDAQVQQRLEQNGIALELYHDRSIFAVGSIRNKCQQPYQVFGAFKRQCYEQLSISIPSCYPDISAQAPLETHPDFHQILPSLARLYSGQSIEPHIQAQWPVTEACAAKQLAHFIKDQLEHYADERDAPALASTSQLGAYLNIGILSIRQCLDTLFAEHGGILNFDHAGAKVWFDELLWREFYQHILFDFPRVSKHLPFKMQTLQIAWRSSDDDLHAWQQGRTGIPIVDAGMRQLLATGWMHNRVRMICAMFLSKNLLIDWRLGEAWFMQHLIDGDLAANNGGWQWCASTGTDAVPYFRIFNPVSQSQRFDDKGEYLRTWLPELAHLDDKTIHAPFAKNPDLALDYPKPMVDLKSSRVRAIQAFKNLS